MTIRRKNRAGSENQSFHTFELFDNTASDLLVVLTDDWSMHLLPSSAMAYEGD